ncbi:MAG: MFS transporter [Gammaproteobacteria bacterium]|nr:MFS transporter [Gammaproteobacteria bacterium]
MKVDRSVFSWALYDWANSAFAVTVMAGFFPLFFKQYWAASLEVADSTFYLGLANGAASLIVAVAAPFLGAMADRGGIKKRLLLGFAAVGIATTGGLYLIDKGAWGMAMACYMVAIIGFSSANVFYDALILDVGHVGVLGRISALGFALGYLGGGMLFAVNVAMTLHPEVFGIADKAMAVRWSFLSVAVWWAVFSVPLWLFVRESHRGTSLHGLPGAAVGRLRDTLGHLRGLRPVWMFLLAYWLYIDGVDTVIRMAVDYGLAIGLKSDDLIVALLITQFVGFPAALVFGWAGDRLGARKGIYAGLAVYVGVCVLAYGMHSEREFYLLAVTIGLVQGGVQALSRSLFASLVPAGHSAEFFGFYNMLGKSAVILGPVVLGLATMVSGDNRMGVLAIIPFFIGGALLLRRA